VVVEVVVVVVVVKEAGGKVERGRGKGRRRILFGPYSLLPKT